MNFSENFRTALRALAANKLRSALTMLGMVIGMGSVVALLAIGNGVAIRIANEVQGIGSNLVSIIPGQSNPSSSGNLYYSDYQALAKNMKNLAGIATAFADNVDLAYGAKTVHLEFKAVTPTYGLVRAYRIEQGRFITENDRAHRAQVAVLGSQTAQDLFGGVNPVGRTILLQDQPYLVVGTLQSKGALGIANADQVVMVPLETAYETLFGSDAQVDGQWIVSEIAISATSPDTVNMVIDQATKFLRLRHKTAPSDPNDFTVLSQKDLLTSVNTITTTLTLFLGAIAGISLLVGGIGIMNIMLVSVTERTREIGLRKAVGARPRTILMQFLVETMTLSFIGGVLGIGLGWGAAVAVAASFGSLIQAQITPLSIVLAFFFTAAVGVFFGLYPAYRASRLRPIEALRHE